VDTKKVVGVLAAIFVIFFIVTQPSQAADITHTLWDGIVNIAHGFADFLNSL
jgi:hypothetical protein